VFSGTVETPLVASLGDEKQVYDMLLSKTALKRIAQPEEVSRVILFLLSDQSSYMTASVRLSPDGPASKLLTSRLGFECRCRLEWDGGMIQTVEGR
jgi:hypothetical protein